MECAHGAWWAYISLRQGVCAHLPPPPPPLLMSGKEDTDPKERFVCRAANSDAEVVCPLPFGAYIRPPPPSPMPRSPPADTAAAVAVAEELSESRRCTGGCARK